eukprot:403353069
MNDFELQKYIDNSQTIMNTDLNNRQASLNNQLIVAQTNLLHNSQSNLRISYINQQQQNQLNTQGNDQTNPSFLYQYQERRDRKGKEIKKGIKGHHITFKDQIPLKTTSSGMGVEQFTDQQQQQQQNYNEDAILSKGEDEDNTSSFESQYSYDDEERQSNRQELISNKDSTGVTTIQLEGDSSQNNNNMKNHNQNVEQQQQKQKQSKAKRHRSNIRREPLHEIIFVESYKDYNASGNSWYQNQCCSMQ